MSETKKESNEELKLLEKECKDSLKDFLKRLVLLALIILLHTLIIAPIILHLHICDNKYDLFFIISLSITINLFLAPSGLSAGKKLSNLLLFEKNKNS